MKCVTGCGRRSVHKHHVVYQQALRVVAGRDKRWFRALYKDTRNLVPVCLKCHADHHATTGKIRVELLPNSVFEFARDVLGDGPAYEYITRRYEGTDSRLEALISDTENENELRAA